MAIKRIANIAACLPRGAHLARSATQRRLQRQAPRVDCSVPPELVPVLARRV